MNRRLHLPATIRATAIAIAMGACAAGPAAADDFYAGKQIAFIVGAGVGGGYDLQARVVARHLGRHIPGNPSIVVQNMPARIAAANHMFGAAPKDGTAIALLQRGILLAKLIYPSGVRYELDKFNWITSLNSEVAVTLAWHNTPHRAAKDLFDKELIVGGITGVDPETTPRLYNALIGTKFKVVTGYNSTAQIALAIERGEVHGIADWSWSSLKAVRPHWLRDKQVTLLMQGALQKDPELGNLPSALDFIKNDVRPQSHGAAFHAEDRSTAGAGAARRAGGAHCDPAQGIRCAGERQGVPCRSREEQGGIRLRVGCGRREGRRPDRRHTR